MSQDNEEGFIPGQIPDRFKAFVEQYAGKTGKELGEAMAKAKNRKERADEKMKPIVAEYDYLRLIAVPQTFEEEGIETIRLAGIGTVMLTGDLYVGVKSKPGLFEWLRDLGKGSLIVETVNAQTLKAVLKVMMRGDAKAGVEPTPIPDEVVKVTPFTRASIKTK